MRKAKLKKRNHLIEGTPLEKKPKPKEPGRRGEQVVFAEKEEYDVAYSDFFEFQKDLDEIEASNEQQRRAEIYGTKEEKEIDTETNTSFVVMEEQDEDDLRVFSPIIMEDYEEVEPTTVFKRCLYIKENGERCKRQAPKSGTLCAAHRKK